MSTVEDVLPWISSLDIGPLSRVSLTGALAGRAAARPTTRAVEVRSRVGTCSLRPDRGRGGGRRGRRSDPSRSDRHGRQQEPGARLLRTNYTNAAREDETLRHLRREFRG